tara:strand:+ start:86 stop:238 length:153 start_codon:yes stop_codon:yes gene_type:complete
MGRQGVVLKRKKGRREAKSLNNFSELKQNERTKISDFLSGTLNHTNKNGK